MMLLMFASFILYAIFYRQVKGYRITDQKQRFASSLKVRHLGDYTNIALEVILALFVVIPVFVLVYYYPILPDRIPVHWNFRGDVDRWARKSFSSVFFLPLMLIYMQGLFLMLKHGMTQTKMTLPAERTEEYLKFKEEQLRITIDLMDWVRFLVGLMLGILSLNIIFSVLNPFLSTLSSIVVGILSILIAAVCFYYIYRIIVVDQELKDTVGRVYVERETDTDHWYGGGLFYYNPDDPALFVEKRVGWGYTVNMANKRGYIYLAYILLIPLLVGWAIMAL
jgi:uncharacterized membrane protein